MGMMQKDRSVEGEAVTIYTKHEKFTTRARTRQFRRMVFKTVYLVGPWWSEPWSKSAARGYHERHYTESQDAIKRFPRSIKPRRVRSRDRTIHKPSHIRRRPYPRCA
jgi:hypothetical protein